MTEEFDFSGTIEQRNMGVNAKGTLYYNVVYLPEGLLEIPSKKRGYRIRGVCHGQPLELALQPDSSRTHYLILSKSLLKKIRKTISDEITVTFRLVDPNIVEIPELLQRGLDRKPKANRVWNTLTAGKKRTWITFIKSAKTIPTQENRVMEVLGRLKDKNLDPKQKWRG